MPRAKKLSPRAKTSGDRYIGEQIKSRRMIAGVTQDTLGKKLNVSFQQVQKYERGVNRVSATRLQQIADVLECTTADLMPPAHGGKIDLETISILELMQSRDGVKLAHAFKVLPEHLRKAAVVVVEQMGAGHP